MPRIVDAHVHLSDRARWQEAYQWHKESPRIDMDFTPAVFTEETVGLGVEKVIFVECMCTEDVGLLEQEAKWICQMAESDNPARVVGCIAGVPLGIRPPSDVAKFLDSIRHKALVGVRKLVQGKPDGFCLTDDYVEGCREVAKRGLVIDLCVKGQMADIVKLVRQVPEGRFMLDHIGKPCIGNGCKWDEQWAADFKELASSPNVFCKISGMVTEATNLKPETFDAYVKHAVDCFGWDRVVYGSDWYASKLATECYKDWLELLVSLPTVSNASEEERQKLFYDNALRCYSLK